MSNTPASKTTADGGFPAADLLKGIADIIGAANGSRTVEGTSIAATIVAYDELEKAASAVSGAVTAKCKGKFLLVQDETAATALLELDLVFQQIDTLCDAADALANEADAGAPGVKGFAPSIVAALIPAAVSLIPALLRREVTENYVTIALDAETFVTMVCKALRANEIDPYTRERLLFALSADPAGHEKGGLYEQTSRLAVSAAALRDRTARLTPPVVPTTADQPDPATPRASANDGLKARMDALVVQIKALEDMIVTGAATLAYADAVDRHCGPDGAFLTLRLLAGGGGTRIEVNSLGRDRVEHSGGVVVSYRLTGRNGTDLASGIVRKLGSWMDADLLAECGPAVA